MLHAGAGRNREIEKMRKKDGDGGSIGDPCLVRNQNVESGKRKGGVWGGCRVQSVGGG